MKLNRISKRINYSKSAIAVILALMSSAGHAAAWLPPTEPVMVNPPGKIYVGIFGGVASSNEFDVHQYGTAFYTEATGGPLAVNAFGRIDDHTSGVIGGHVGYQWIEPLNSSWSLGPAIELEGYYLGKKTFTGHDVTNDTPRLPAHDFLLTYPTKTGVFLTNAVLNINSSSFARFHPYVGVGLGGAVVSISNATATQISPPEPGINHYNSNPSDKAPTFAGQAKVGLNVDIFKNLSIFADYRWLYLASTSYEFGSTVYAGHPETSNWQVKMDPRHYNVGTIGLQLNI